MAVFQSDEQLKEILRRLFDRVGADPLAAKTLVKSKLIIRIRTTRPIAAVTINGRKDPPELLYTENNLRPDLDIEVGAETLHKILLKELRLRNAIATRALNVKGPVWKSFILEEIFHSAQSLYPDVVKEMGLN